MAISEVFYLTCSRCGKIHCNEDGSTMLTETPEEVRDDAEESGWVCYVGEQQSLSQKDYCGSCAEKESGNVANNPTA